MRKMSKEISLKKLVGKGYNKFWNTKAFYRVVKGGRGSKKSVTTQMNLIYKIMKYPWCNVLVLRRYQNTLRDSCWSGLKWATVHLGVDNLWVFSVSPMQATYLPTGQKILFRGFDDALKLTSIQLERGTITDVWVEEAYELENPDKLDTVVESIRGQITYTDRRTNKTVIAPNAYRQVTITFNPWSDTHWLKSRFFDVEDEDIFTDTTTYKCNEFLDEQTKKRYESLFKTNPRRANIVCNGDWGVAEGLVFENVRFEPLDKDALAKKGYRLLIGLDYGFTHDPTALICSWLDEENERLYIFDEHYEVGMLTKDIAQMIKRKGYSKSMIIADCAENRLNQELITEHGIRKLRASKKGKGSIRAGLDKLGGLEIICDINCVNTKAEFLTYSFKFDKVAGRFLNEPEDANNHLMDALRYSLQCKDNAAQINFINGGI